MGYPRISFHVKWLLRMEEFWVTAADILEQPRKTGQSEKNVTGVCYRFDDVAIS